MPDLNVEELVAQITAKVTAEVLGLLGTHIPVAPADDWPDYDEYNLEPAAATPDTEPVEPRQSPLRARLLAGVVDVPEPDADDDLPESPRVPNSERGPVAPVTADTWSERGTGFNPSGNDAWLTRQYQREVILAKRAVPLEDQIKAV